MAKLGTPSRHWCCFRVTYTDVDRIRAPTPRLTRAAALCLSLGAAGAFASGLARQVMEPLAPPPAEVAAHPVAAEPAPAPVQPAMQVTAAQPAPRRSSRLDAPDPPPVLPIAAEPAAEPALAAAPETPVAKPAAAPIKADEPPAV